MYYILIIFILILILISIKLYMAIKFKKYILSVIFILQNIDIDVYYDEYFAIEIEKGKYNTQDNFEELFGKDIKIYLSEVPKIWKLVLSFKRYKIENWMNDNFTIKYNIFVKDRFEYLYSKYKTQAYSIQMFLINK